MEVIATEFFSALKIVLKYGYIFFPAFSAILVGIAILIKTIKMIGDKECNYVENVLRCSLFFEAFLVVANVLSL